jgi:hypothetical protein
MKTQPGAALTKQHSLFMALAVALAPLVVASMKGQPISLEAEFGEISAPFIVTNGCLSQRVPTTTTNAGRVVYHFTITNGGSYVILARVLSPQATNTLSVNIDGEPEGPTMIWDIPCSNEFTNRLVSWRQGSAGANAVFGRKIFALGAGTHRLIIRGCGGDVLLDRLAIVRLPSPPGGLRLSAAN